MSSERKVAVITGASQGIGAGLVRGFLNRGYRVVANSRSIKPDASADVITIAGDIAEGLATLYLKYKAAKVPAELHIFANAGHGFGYRPDAKPSAAARWPERFTEWLGDNGLLQ